MFAGFCVREARRADGVRAMLCVMVVLACGAGGWAQGAAQGTLHVVRAGFGSVEGMKRDIAMSEDACRVAKSMPQGDAVLPSDAFLKTLRVMETEELFDGQLYASYETQRQVGADATDGCKPALFIERHATADRTCASRVRGGSAALGQLMDFETVTPEKPEVFEQSLPARPCAEKVRLQDLEGLPREDTGAARCVWSSAILAKQMAKIGMATGDDAGKGIDFCYYEAMPKYFFQGYGRPVTLMSKRPRDHMDESLGVASAIGNEKLQTFAAGGALDKARFSRAGVESFLGQPTKTAVGSGM